MDYMNDITTKRLKKLENDLQILYAEASEEAINQLEKILVKLETDLTPEQRILELRKKEKLEKLIEKMTNNIEIANKEAVNMINDELVQTYINNQQYGAYLVEHNSGFKVDWTLYNKQTIKEILTGKTNPFFELALDEFKDQDIIRRALTRELLQGILLGESIPKIAERIQNIAEKNLNDSVRIARTETTKAENAGRLDSFKQAEKQGLKIKKVWSSTIDNRTRMSHAKLNGEERDLEEEFSNGCMYPGKGGTASEVVNCRCSMTTEFVGLEKGAKEKQLDVKLKKMSFEEWGEL